MTMPRESDCRTCGGFGHIDRPVMGQVTREMALDACEPDMEGMDIELGVEQVECPECHGESQ